jgi:NTP pyrophosphatase (non-canonical NTP hydrolase)
MYNYQLNDAFEYISKVNVERCNRWHGPDGLNSWSILEWAGALCGEAGELANIAKKLHRIRTGMDNYDGFDTNKLKKELAEEIADVFCYLQLIAAKENIEMYPAIAAKFNKVSARYGFPEQLLEFPNVTT